MAIKEQLLPLLENAQKDIEIAFDKSTNHIWTTKQLKEFLGSLDSIKFIFDYTRLNIDNITLFLIEKSYLRKQKFLTPRTEILYLWRSVNAYELMPQIRPAGYYTHLSAMYFHKLINYEPKRIYFNNEQSARPSTGILDQGRIDNAFRKKQRITSARTIFEDKEYWLLNGKQTGNYGLVSTKLSNGIEINITNLERTLIDITVRPAYAGGVNSVLKAYRLAQPNVSISVIENTLRALNYIYPYHQSIGFYMQISGLYDKQVIQKLLNFKPIDYDFYLDYEMLNPIYSEQWRIYYPNELSSVYSSSSSDSS